MFIVKIESTTPPPVTIYVSGARSFSSHSFDANPEKVHKWRNRAVAIKHASAIAGYYAHVLDPRRIFVVDLKAGTQTEVLPRMLRQSHG